MDLATSVCMIYFVFCSFTGAGKTTIMEARVFLFLGRDPER
jgi:hypothetical protein